VWIVRSIVTPGKGGGISEVHVNGLKGFLKTWPKKDNFSVEFSIYDRDDKRSMLGSIIVKKAYFYEKDVLAILSSIDFLKPEEPSLARNHYEKGWELYQCGDVLKARVEFANAYYLSPEDPDYIFMFAKSLPVREVKNYKHIKELLDTVLKLNPDHLEAQKLLKEIEARVPKEAKK
jgi:tetratricopeptide (TPR) repeat protein